MIEKIVNTLNSLFGRVRHPAQTVSPVLTLCSSLQKPGLSTIHSVARIVTKMKKLGIPTDPMPDGSMNLNIGLVTAIVDEVYRAMREDAQVNIAIKPGSIQVVGEGGNAGGPVVVHSTNPTIPGGTGSIQ